MSWYRLFWRFILQRMYNVYMFRRLFPQEWVRSYALWHPLVHMPQYRFMLKHGQKSYIIRPMSLARMSYRCMTLYSTTLLDYSLELHYYTQMEPCVDDYLKVACFISWKTKMLADFEMNSDLPTGRK